MDPVLLALAATLGSGVTAAVATGAALLTTWRRERRLVQGGPVQTRIERLRQLDGAALAQFAHEAEVLAEAAATRKPRS